MLDSWRAVLGLLIVLVLLGHGTSARAQEGRRIALVIGNATYDANGPLSLPASRGAADAIANALEQANFEVVRKYDLDWAQFDASLADFERAAATASVVLLYYSGHVLHVSDRTYLMPIGATLETRQSVAFQTIDLEEDVIRRVMGDRPRKIVLIDAPALNPVADQYALKFDPRHEVGSNRGMAPLPSIDGLLIGSAIKADEVLPRAKVSLYATAIANLLGTPGLEARALLDQAGGIVRTRSNDKQKPVYAAMRSWSDFYFVPPQTDEEVWAEIKTSEDAAVFLRFKARFPRSQYNAIASERADALARAATARDQAARDQAARDQAARDPAARDQAARDQAARDQAARDPAARDQAARDQATRDQAARDQATRDQAARDQAARDQAARDQAARDQAAKDQAAKDQAAKDQTTHGRESEKGRGTERENVAQQAAKAGKILRDCAECPELIVIPGGTFQMGTSTEDVDDGRGGSNEQPQREATVAKPLAVGRFTITVDQFASFTKAAGYVAASECYTMEDKATKRKLRSFKNPGYKVTGIFPAACVSWTDAMAYVRWIGSLTGHQYRLLSEVEYEYLAHDGTTFQYGPGDDASAICQWANGSDKSAERAKIPTDPDHLDCDDGYAYAAPVGSFKANRFGLSDMLGNVWQWTSDCYHETYSASQLTDVGCDAMSVRGGSWSSSARSLRPAMRAKSPLQNRYDDVGFRVARDVQPSD